MNNNNKSTSKYYFRQNHLEDLTFKKNLLNAQPPHVRDFFSDQAWIIVKTIEEGKESLCFHFPDNLIIPSDPNGGMLQKASILPRYRTQKIAKRLHWKNHQDLVSRLIDRLDELERSTSIAVGLCAKLLRYLIAVRLFNQLPYPKADGEAQVIEAMVARNDFSLLENRYFGDNNAPASQISMGNKNNAKRTSFFPEWAAFDHQGVLLELSEAEINQRMQRLQDYIHQLFLILAIEPAMMDDGDFQACYWGMANQWRQQGKAFAHYQTLQIVRSIRKRVEDNSLNRGLSISLPYFDDQALEIRLFDFEVIPPGRILFDPNFMIDAVEISKQRVKDDISFDEITKENIISELDFLQKAFAFHRPFTPVGLILETQGILLNQDQKEHRRISH
ncbi:MAG: hypothetical protein ACPL3P_04800 [Anaerolineales bacterium]